MTESLTIFLTAYERPSFLKECLISLKNQTYKNFKIIVLDNSKSNKNEEIINKNKDLKIKYFKNKVNIGAVNNIHQAYDWSINTKYFMIFHDDDKMHPEYIEKCMEILTKNNNITWVGSDYTNDAKLKKIDNLKKKILSKKDLIKETFKGISFAYSSLIYDKEKIQKINFSYYFIKYSILCDRPIIIDLVNDHDNICLVENELIFYRIHEAQDSKTSSSEVKVNDQLNFYEYYRQNMRKNFLDLFYYNLWISNTIFGSFRRLYNKDKISLIKFLLLAKKRNLIDVIFPFYYILGKIYNKFKILKKNKN